MRVWWQFRCDVGHSWEITSSDGIEPPADAVRCPVDGREAVTAKHMPPADRVRLSLIPAARISDPVKNTVELEGHYFLEVASADGANTLTSVDKYGFDDAVSRLSLFVHDTWEAAAVRMRRLKLSASSDD
ncbi:MAG: hypothetical protein QOG34_23 [Frankiaceae bacterium]|jgi:hypothetical protein|nr:hypothetical protein [Frankiaceae bacterium]